MDLMLKKIIDGLENTSGQEFFNRIVLNFANVIKVDYVFIAKLDLNRYVSTTIALSAKGEIVDNFEYKLQDTPCANVADDSLCCYPSNITKLFPKDKLLIDMNIEGYIGSPLRNSKGNVIGLTVALSQRPIENENRVVTLFEIFANRIAVEIERDEQEKKIKSFNIELERKVEEEIAKRQEQEKIMLYQARYAAIGELMNNIAHQWRQPLNLIRLLLDNIYFLYEDGELSKDELNSNFSKVGLTLDKLSNTINKFSDFFKPNENKRAFKVKKVIKDAISLIITKLMEENIKINLKNIQDIEIYGFENAFAQSLFYIINNAKEAIERNSIKNGKIVIEATKEDEYLIIKVKDNAGGIDKHILEKVFEPYFTTKFQAQGVGLGLYITKMIIEEHLEGKISVKNIDNGVEFTMKLPINSTKLNDLIL